MSSESKVTFFSKNKIACPVCESTFFREDLLTGRGRLIAGNLTDELRRLYEPSDKFGDVFPLIYPIMVCPACYYAAFSQDFLSLDEETKTKIDQDADRRLHTVSLLFDELDFREPRTLREGIASYYFAMMCYDLFHTDHSPTIKQGLCALRAAWLSNDFAVQEPEENYEELAVLFYRKACFFYNLAIEYEQNGKESISAVAHLGAYLELNYGTQTDPTKRLGSLKVAKRTVAKIFGIGKATKNKPTAILDLSRDLYDKLGAEIAEGGGDGES